MKKQRLAYFSPFSPQRSGISDYSEELLPYLRELADLTVVTGPYQPDAPALRGLPVIGTVEFLRHRATFDGVLYQVGNNLEHHGYMIECLAQVPGIVVLHDYCLHYLMLGLTLMRGDLAALASGLEICYGARAGSLARQLLFGTSDPFQLSFAGPLVQNSRAVIVHSHFAEQCVRRDFPEKNLRVIPMGVPLELDERPDPALRSKYGFAEQDFVVASINSPAHNKRLPLVLHALRDVRERHSQVKLVILSGAHYGAETRDLLRDPRLEGAVVCPGWLSSDVYHDYIRLADVIVDARYPSGAETSASLMRAIASGKALVLSAQGTFIELPEEICLKIPVGPGEREAWSAALAQLAENRNRVVEMGLAARRFALSNLSLEQAARSYAEFTSEVALGDPMPVPKWVPRQEASPLKRAAVAATYKASRTVGFLRTYGLAETITRVRRELSGRGPV